MICHCPHVSECSSASPVSLQCFNCSNMSTSTTYFGSIANPRAPKNVEPHVNEEMEEKEDCDAVKLLQCPFDQNHQIRACRFPYHLIKCRKNHPKLARDLKTCPYNARHLFPVHEMSLHTATCEDRKSVSLDESSNAEVQRKWQVPVSTWTNPQTDEDWESEADDAAVPFVWGTASTSFLQPEATDGLIYEHNLSAGLRAPKTLPWPVDVDQ
ncbi:gametocyte-specific factor 1 [Gadus chalcogrammus]|uniref:gametocyte-specific factor 1 n=1 Tax=Gadus chalcogrammus TaxID=1042646 RepID=UPI0024C28AD2|nr:gametocyte-specific factor 1 [Gadus chalcogrammus]